MKVLVISLPRSVDRRAAASRQLADLAIPFEFLDAVDGRSSGHPLLARHDAAKFLINCGRPANPGELGCYASHLLAWQRCIDLDEPLLILEDDFRLLDGFAAAFASCERLLPEYGYIRLETTRRSRAVRERSDGDFTLVKYLKAPQGALCYGISPPAARALVSHSNEFVFPVDVFVRNFFLHRIPLFGLRPYTATQSELAHNSLIGKRGKHPKPPGIALRRFLARVRRVVMNGKENLLFAVGIRKAAGLGAVTRPGSP